jgi:hypothetical protein
VESPLARVSPIHRHAMLSPVLLELPGQFGSLAAVPQQQPGWALAIVSYYTSVKAGGSVAAAREVTIGKFNPTVSVNLNVNLNANAESR